MKVRFTLKTFFLAFTGCVVSVVAIYNLLFTRIVVANSTGEKIEEVRVLSDSGEYLLGSLPVENSKSVLIWNPKEASITATGKSASGRLYSNSIYVTTDLMGTVERISLEEETVTNAGGEKTDK